MEEFSAFQMARMFLNRWWIMVLLVSGGGIGGLVFHKVIPPVYEAKAVLEVNIDVSQYCLPQYEADRALSIVSMLINSPDVKQAVVNQAQSSGQPVTLTRFQQSSVLEIRRSIMEMRVRDQNPVAAAVLANLWAEIAYDRLIQAQEHAIKANRLQQQLTGWLMCLPGYVTPTPGSSTSQILVVPSCQILVVPSWNEKCENYTTEKIEEVQSQLSAEIDTEQRQSLGVLPFLNFVLAEKASVPDQPILYGQGIFALAGAVIGLVVSVWIILSEAMQHNG